MNLNFYTKMMNLLFSFKKTLALVIAGVIFGGSAFSQVGATALNFDGVNDYVTIPVINNNNAGALNISSAITIEAWINPSKSTGTQDVLCKSMNSPNNGYVFPRTSDGWKTIEFLLNINGYGWKVLKVIYGQAKLNQWHHVAASYDGLKMRIFIDGTQAGEYAFAGSITVNNNPLTIGNQPGFNEYFGGSVDEIRVWNRAIIGCEILNNMTCQLGGTQNGLAAYYQFNQGLVNAANTGISQLNDSGPSLANGTLINFGYNGLVSNWCAGSSVTGTCAVYTPPVISAGSLQSVVPIGGTISLTASSNVAGSTYAWVGPNGFTSTQQNPVIAGASQAASGTYTVTITGNGCATTASTIVTVALMASALNFDGVDDYISVPFTPSVDLKTFTVETWINPTTSITPVQNIVSNASRASNNGFKFPKTNDGWTTFSFELSVNNQWQTVSAPFPASALGQWNHLAATYDGYFMKMYLNGALVAISEVTGTFTNNTNNLIIGNQDGVAEYFKGSIDELRIWSRAQSQCEIINNMKTCELNGDNNGMAQQIGLSAYYRLNQGLINVSNATVTTAADSSGHANDGTLYNFNLNGSTSTWVQGKVNGVCAYFPQPLLSASANGSAFQVGSTVKLFAVNGNNGSYSWNGPNSFVSIDSTPVIPNVQQIQAGTYTVSTPYTNCVVTASTRFRITTATQIIANGPTNICPSASVTLSTASQGTSYQWYKNDVAIVGETNNQYVASQTGNYTVTITNASDVTVSAPIAVTVVPDILAPVPDASTLPALTINVGATVTAIPTATDNCRGIVNGTANQSLTFNTLGTFTIVWTYDDLNGNTSVQNQQVTVLDNIPPVLTVPSDMSVQAVSGVCSAVANFTATATDNSGLPVNITYSINPGSTFALGVTTVNVTATDASNNSSSGSFIVTVTPAAVAPITGNTTICAGSTGTLSSATIGGSWSSNNTAVATVDAAGVVTALAAGTANISYTDACGSSVTAAITVNPLPSVPVVTVVNNCGSSTLSTNAAGTLLWSTGVNTPSVAVNAAGTYTVTQTVNGCTSAAGSGIALPLAVPAAPAVSVTNNCGTSILSTNAAGALLWNTGANTSSISVNGAGTYSVTQTSVNGCTSAAGSGTAAPLAIPSAPVVTVADNCGSSVLSTNAAGSLLWSTGSAAASITVTTGGTYTVTQTVNGCVSAAGSGLAAPNAIPSTPVVTVADNCGTSTLSTNAAGTLLWSTGANTPSITVSSTGTYSVSQTVGGCTSAAGSGNASPIALPATPVVTVTNNCGTSTLSTNATGTLLWNTGANTPSITVIGAGTYTVTQTANGCTSVAGSGLAAPNAIPSAPVVTVTDNCGSSVLSTNAAGSLLWSTGSAASSITVTTGGTYTVTQTVNGCVSAAGSGLAAPNAIPSAPVITVVNNCGTSTLSTNAAGILLWNTTATTPSVTVNSAGTYSVTQTVGGCTSVAGSATAAPLAIPSAPVITVVNNCGTSTLSTNAAGILLWNTTATTPSVTVNSAGTYSVTQTVGGCTSVAGSATAAPLAIPSAPVVTAADNCGASTLSTNAAGTLLWSTGENTSSIIVSNGGTYTVTQTINGCTSTAGSGTAAPKAVAATPVITVVNNCGSSTLSTNAGGSLLWSNLATTSSVNVTASGNYSVTVTNANGCSATSAVTAVSVNTIPVVGAITGATAVTAGSSTQLSDGSAGGVWTSSNTAIATVNASGLVTGVTAGSATITYTVTGAGGCSTAVTATVTVNPSCVTPVFTAISNISVNAVSGCAAPVTYTASVTGNPALTYIFSGATSGTGSGTGSGAAFNLGTTTVVITAVNACGTATISFSVTVINAAPVTATITPANADAFCNSIVLTGNANAATYQWVSPNGNTYGNTAQISLGQGNAEGVYHLYVTGDNGCTGSTGAAYNYQRQNLVNSYAILAFSKVQLGNNNTVNGGVGVTSAWGYVGLGSYTNITAPGSFVKAANINTRGWGVTVTNLIHSAATGIGLPTMYYNTASTKKLPDASVKEQTVTTLNGNYGELTLKKGSITTLTGNTFGSIKVEQGAQVIFASSSTVNIDQLEVDKGPRNGYTYIRFSQDTKVLISSHVSIGSNCFVNPDNNKVTFYLGDSSPDDEKFTVKGGDTKVNANVYVPKGAIKVTGGNQYGDYGGGHHDNDDEDDDDRYSGQGNAIVYMTGFYIADQVSSDGKNVVWNTFDCSAAPVSVINTSTGVQQVTAKTATSESSVVKASTTEEELKITVMPNPSTTYFTLKFESKYETPVNMRVMDASGRVVDAKSKIGSNSTIQIGASYASGTYYAEMIQGTHHKVVQLLKIN